MSTNCVRCVVNERTKDLLCDDCHEKEMLKLATEKFSEAIIAQLHEQVDIGYEGWEGAYPSGDLRDEIYHDALEMVGTAIDDKAVDIAARCMMLWYREKKAAT